MNFKNRVVIVTGAGGGIGLAVARMFARGGANVLITGRRQQQLEKVASQERGIEPFVADAGSPDDASRTVEKAVQLWHRLDVLVNNAGAGMPSALVDVTDESLGTVYRINTIGPTLLAAAAVPHLAKTRGTILNISSSLATKPVSGLSAYAASKAALEHLTRCWALELAPRGIRVNAIASGPVESNFLEERMGYSGAEAEAIKQHERTIIPLGRRGTPEDVAHWIVALAHHDAQWVTGQILGIDGGFRLV